MNLIKGEPTIDNTTNIFLNNSIGLKETLKNLPKLPSNHLEVARRS